jgi:D-alanyl-lipoteichoic acid acyltransferase DltB (MBOAT superfamily)
MDKKKTIWLIVGLIINIGILGFFKYYNFFIDSFIDLVSLIGYSLPKSTTKIVLPIGISFYIFLSLSYILDIYKKNLSSNRNIVEVLLSLSFFPIILAGPIQRPSTLLPQIIKRREFNYYQAVDGLRQILWGLFAKVVIADNLALHVDNIFSNFSKYSGSTLVVGAVFYAIQIYADFSGYSNIAIGIAKLFGFRLMQNFAYPYFSRDIREFWKRWHISLVTWFRDYLFLPISFTLSWRRIKNDKVVSIKSDMFIYIVVSTIVWFLTGLWHGANYTFIVWGMIHGFFLVIYHWQIKPRKRIFKRMGITNRNNIIVIVETLITLFIVVIAWVFFRAESMCHAINYLSQIFSISIFTIPEILPKSTLIPIILFFIIEWVGREKQFAIANLEFKWSKPFRWIFYFIMIFSIYFLGNFSETVEYIYFQF